MGGSSLSIAGHVAGKVGQEAEAVGVKIEASGKSQVLRYF